MVSLNDALADTAAKVEKFLDQLLAVEDATEHRLHEAIRYATLDGGKRLRPFLVMQSASLFGVGERSALRTGAALELIHCDSLVHDDLPAMDDDDLRRGKPTVHKEFDEATAILTGDALQPLAFEVLAHPETHSNANVRVDLIAALARASGAHGMVGGQMIDLQAETETFDIGQITRLQRLKTGELIAYACEAGAILGQAPNKAHEALRRYAHDLGLAFQIADDLLDVEGSVEEVGKAVNKDEDAGKATFVSILGVERARSQANRLADQAIAHLALFGDKADLLCQAAKFVVERKS
jgi:farnesyl diphosphate synthase